PAPEVSGRGESGNGECGKRCRRIGGEENWILADDDGGIGPVHAHGGGAQTHQSGVTPFGTDAKPPPRSSCKSAFVLAPATVGPKASKPISDWRRVAPKLPPESPGGRAKARV